MRQTAKALLRALFSLIAFPLAAVCGFGRIQAIYTMGAHLCALAPGIAGDYLRVAFYRMTLEECSYAARISFGTYFAHREARVAAGVYIGSYCVMGKVEIGPRTQIASGVQILSGSRQHQRDAMGQIEGAEHGVFQTVSVGADCWIGAAAVIMADIGAGATVGAGSIVTKPVDSGVVVAGNPARVLKS